MEYLKLTVIGDLFKSMVISSLTPLTLSIIKCKSTLIEFHVKL